MERSDVWSQYVGHNEAEFALHFYEDRPSILAVEVGGYNDQQICITQARSVEIAGPRGEVSRVSALVRLPADHAACIHRAPALLVQLLEAGEAAAREKTGAPPPPPSPSSGFIPLHLEPPLRDRLLPPHVGAPFS